MIAFCYCLSFAFDKAQTSYSVVSNVLSLAVTVPLIAINIGVTTGSTPPPLPPPTFAKLMIAAFHFLPRYAAAPLPIPLCDSLLRH